MTRALFAPRLAPVPNRYTAAYPRGGSSRFAGTPFSPVMVALPGKASDDSS